MFIGHYAPAFLAAGTKRGDRRGLGLGAMFVAAQLVDVAFFSFVLTGAEHMRETPGLTAMSAGDFYDMPYTHSLIGTLAFAAAWAIGARVLRQGRRAAWIGAAVVASHWLLDLAVHAPDLTLFGHGPRYGFALWDRPLVEMPLELGLVTLAAVFYLSRTRPRMRAAPFAAAVLGAALLTLQLVNWFGEKPTAVVDPVPAATPLTALAAYALLAALAWWTAHTRRIPA